MQKITSFTQLTTWKEAYKLVIDIYKTTKSFPREEVYSLTDQIKRAAVSIASNIAEGFTRQSKKEKLQFYYMPKGSLTELQNQLLIAKGVGYLSSGDFTPLANQTVTVHKLLNGLMKTANAKY